MKKCIIALSVAAAMGGFAGSASAQATDHLVFNPLGVGHLLLVPYFSAQSANVSAINIVNTDTVHGKVIKVRFRGASNSDDVYDFQVFLSPGDMWTAGISQGADGRAQLATTDKSCTLPANVNGSFIIGRTATAAPDRNAETREGYIEVLTMADIVKTSGNELALYNATKHVNGVAPCTSSVLTALTHENADSYMAKPTTGIMANWTIVNVARFLVYSGAAAAIEARSIASGDAIAGNLVYWDQRSTPLTSGELTANTADPLLVGGYVGGARYDLPDLSTPYLGSCCTPAAQALALSDSIAARTIAGEFNNLSSLGASTDWVVSFPTRRYHAAVQYTSSGGTARYGAANPYFNSGNMELKGYQLCSRLGLNALGFFDREEKSPLVDDIVISPGTPVSLSLCGEVAVLGINGGIDAAGIAASATFGSLTRANASNGFTEGWGYFTTPSADGLPMLANQFTRYSNTTTNVYYGTNYPARVLEKGMMAP
jgi:hypothetical protein